jgi:hypothetical protein
MRRATLERMDWLWDTGCGVRGGVVRVPPTAVTPLI